MTTSPTTDIQPELLPVVQADREAAAEYDLMIGRISPLDAAAIRAGEWDGTSDVQFFARHRLTFTTPTLGDMEPTDAMLRAGYEKWEGGSADECKAIWCAMLSAAPASPIPISVNGAGERKPDLRTVLTEALYFAVCTLAFHGRDRGTDRQEKMLDDMEDLARDLDPRVRAALAVLSPALDNTAVEGLRTALEPVMHWYQSDEHEARPLLDIVADVVADLQEDRKAALAKRAFTDEQITALAERFCATPLPNSVYADACARLPGVSGRTGTNLLTVSEAEQMLRAALTAETGKAR